MTDTFTYNGRFQRKKEESPVTSMWTKILLNYFPAPHFMVETETIVGDGLKSDLIVLRGFGKQQTLIFVVECKSASWAATDASFDRHFKQLAGYMGSSKLRGPENTWVHGALAIGRAVRFYKVDVGGEEDDVKPRSIQRASYALDTTTLQTSANQTLDVEEDYLKIDILIRKTARMALGLEPYDPKA